MKSEQQENKLTISTSCKDCIFYESGKCKANRIDVFKEKGRVIDENPHKIHGVCNLKRLRDWKNASSKDSLDIARKDIMPLFGIVVFDSEEEDSSIFETIDSLMEIDYPTDKIKIVISSRSKKRSEKLLHYSEKVRSKFRHCLVDFHFYKNTEEEEYTAFSKLAKATYFVKINHDSKLPKDIFLMINDLVNIQLENAAVFELDNNDSIIMKKLVSSAYLKYNDYEKMKNDLFIKSKESNLYYFIGDAK